MYVRVRACPCVWPSATGAQHYTALPFCITRMQGIPAIATWYQRLRHTHTHTRKDPRLTQPG